MTLRQIALRSARKNKAPFYVMLDSESKAKGKVVRFPKALLDKGWYIDAKAQPDLGLLVAKQIDGKLCYIEACALLDTSSDGTPIAPQVPPIPETMQEVIDTYDEETIMKVLECGK